MEASGGMHGVAAAGYHSRGMTPRAYGNVSADQQKVMSGRKSVEGLVDGTEPLKRIAQTLAMT